MQGWLILAIIALVIWGLAQRRRRSGGSDDSQARQALIEAERERDELRERVQVLERIVTDENTPDAKKTKQLAQEIESLRREEGRGHGKNTEDMSE